MPYSQLLRKRSSSIGRALLIYHLVFTVIAVGIAYLPLIMAKAEAARLGRTLSGWRKRQLELKALQNAWGYIVAISVGFLLLLLWKKKKFTFSTIFHQGRPMGAGSFMCLLLLSTSVQVIYRLMTSIFSSTAMASTIGKGFDSYAFSMFLYIGIAGPIFEEIFFRGAALRHLQPYGKRIAIFGSAFLFGIFHGNIYQIPFAFFIGLFYGYTAVEYSIFWSMLLHMINNLVLGDMFTRLIPLWGYSTIEGLLSIAVYGSAIASVIILILQRDRIAAYNRENPILPGSFKAFFTAPGILAFTIYMIIHTIISWNVTGGFI